MKKDLKAIDEILREPYLRALIFDRESDTYTAEISEFPGCVAQGKSPQEANERLEAAARSWLEAAIDLGHEVPKPFLVTGYSGKVALRLPKSLHKLAVSAAEKDGTSLNQFIVCSVAERVSRTDVYQRLSETFALQVKESLGKYFSAEGGHYQWTAATEDKEPVSIN